MNSAEQIRVVVVDAHAVVRAGLRALLQPASEVMVVGDAASAAEGVALVRQTQAQVLVVDRPSEGEDLAAVAHLVSSAMIHTNLLVLTTVTSPVTLESLLLQGARGYLTRAASPADLLTAVRTVASGALYRCVSTAEPRRVGLPAPVAEETDQRRFDRLTEREREVLVCTAQGFSAPEIGARLHISAKTVDTYKHRIHEKLGLHHRADYVRLVMRLHLMDVE